MPPARKVSHDEARLRDLKKALIRLRQVWAVIEIEGFEDELYREKAVWLLQKLVEYEQIQLEKLKILLREREGGL